MNPPQASIHPSYNRLQTAIDSHLASVYRENSHFGTLIEHLPEDVVQLNKIRKELVEKWKEMDEATELNVGYRRKLMTIVDVKMKDILRRNFCVESGVRPGMHIVEIGPPPQIPALGAGPSSSESDKSAVTPEDKNTVNPAEICSVELTVESKEKNIIPRVPGEAPKELKQNQEIANVEEPCTTRPLTLDDIQAMTPTHFKVKTVTFQEIQSSSSGKISSTTTNIRYRDNRSEVSSTTPSTFHRFSYQELHSERDIARVVFKLDVEGELFIAFLDPWASETTVSFDTVCSRNPNESQVSWPVPECTVTYGWSYRGETGAFFFDNRAMVEIGLPLGKTFRHDVGLVTSHKLGHIYLGLDFVLQHQVEVRWWDDTGRGFVYLYGNRLPCKIIHEGRHQPPDVGLDTPGRFIPAQYLNVNRRKFNL